MTMIERVARAIEAARIPDMGGSSHTSRFSTIEEVAEQYREEARAAIKAMREPTKEMRETAWDHELDPWDNAIYPRHAEANWQMMIDAALSEHQNDGVPGKTG